MGVTNIMKLTGVSHLKSKIYKQNLIISILLLKGDIMLKSWKVKTLAH